MRNGIKPVPWRVKTREQKAILFIGDLLATALAFFGAMYVWAYYDAAFEFGWDFIRVRPQWWFYILPVVWMLLLVELYEPRKANNRKETMRGIALAGLVSVGVYLLIFFLIEGLPRIGVGGFLIAAMVLTTLWRYSYIGIFTAPLFMRRVLILGAGKSGNTLVHVLRETWPPPFYLVGLIDDDPQKIGSVIFDYPILGGSKCLTQVIEDEAVTDLILAISGEMNGEMFQALLDAEEKGIQVTTMPVVYEEILGRVPIFLLEADWIIRSFVDQVHASAIYEMAKRLMDVLGALVGLLLLALVVIPVSVAIALDTGFPIFFTQNRLGKSGKTYKIIKFRTMVQDAERDGQPQTTSMKDPRVTRAGRFLRKSHIDELPQFINVLKGEMSLVGPRAERSELVAELQNNIPFYRARLLVKPGITGWAQVNQMYASTVDESAVKLEYDLYYIKHRNLLNDLTIILRTFGTVVGFRGR